MAKNLLLPRNDVQMFDVNVNDVETLFSFVDSNRCHGDNGRSEFSDVTIKKAKNRIRGYKNKLFSRYTWSDATPLIVHKVLEEGGKMYITDGQGRYEAVKLLNRESKSDIPVIETIPVLVYTVATRKEMENAIISMNTFSKNWTNDDILHHRAICEGGDAAQMFELIKDVMNSLDCSDQVARLIIMGNSFSSKKEDTFDRPFDELASPRRIETYNFFENFYNSLSVRSPKLNRKLRSSTAAIALDSVVSAAYRLFYNDKAECTHVINKCCDVLIKSILKMDDLEFLNLMQMRAAEMRRNLGRLIERNSKDQKLKQVVIELEEQSLGRKTA